MASSSQIYSQAESARKLANSYSGVNPNDVYQNLVNRVGAFRPQYNELGQLEAQTYATAPNMLSQYYNQYGEAPGSGTSAASRLSSIMDTIGQQSGTMNAMRGSISAQQGNLKDILSGITQQYTNQGDSAWKNYSALQSQYQTQLSAEQAAASRAAAAKAAKLNIPDIPGLKYDSKTGKWIVTTPDTKSTVNPIVGGYNTGGLASTSTGTLMRGYQAPSQSQYNISPVSLAPKQSTTPKFSLKNLSLSNLFGK